MRKATKNTHKKTHLGNMTKNQEKKRAQRTETKGKSNIEKQRFTNTKRNKDPVMTIEQK